MTAKIFVLLFVVVASIAGGQDWGQFLGPNRNGSIADDAFVKAWLKNGLRERWRIPVGEGYSGIVVQGDLLYTMDSSGGSEFVFCVRVSDGKEVWRVRTGDSPRDVYGGLGPRVTPAIDQNLVLTVSASGNLLALQAESGKLLWKRELGRDHGWRPPAEGTSCSPLIADGRIYLMNGGPGESAVAAFDRNTGKTLWTALSDRASYSSALRWDFHNAKQALFLTGANLFSVDAATGKLLWKYPWQTYDFVNVATPLIVPPDKIFISSGYDQGAALLRISKKENGTFQATELWRNREMKNHFNNSVYHSGIFYGFDNAVLKAVDETTGQTLWRESGFGKGSLILSAGYLIVLSERGELVCAKAARQGFLPLARMTPLKGQCWTPPSIAQGKIFLRNAKEAVCLQP